MLNIQRNSILEECHLLSTLPCKDLGALVKLIAVLVEPLSKPDKLEIKICEPGILFISRTLSW